MTRPGFWKGAALAALLVPSAVSAAPAGLQVPGGAKH
jgi:hypothetical protein